MGPVIGSSGVLGHIMLPPLPTLQRFSLGATVMPWTLSWDLAMYGELLRRLGSWSGLLRTSWNSGGAWIRAVGSRDAPAKGQRLLLLTPGVGIPMMVDYLFLWWVPCVVDVGWTGIDRNVLQRYLQYAVSYFVCRSPIFGLWYRWAMDDGRWTDVYSWTVAF